METYPVFLDLRERSCVVVGGGALAEEKARGLLAAGAAVTIIARELTPGLDGLVGEGRITHRPRSYEAGDLAGAALAVVCGEPAGIVEAVWEEARGRNVLVNTVDDLAHCGFLAPSIVRRGDLAVAISTNGKAPTLAVRLRQRFERELGEEYGRFLALAGSVRSRLAACRPDFAERREIWYRLVDSDVLDRLREGEEEAARARFAEILGVEP
jgi:siroheme synthase-like protein